MDTATRRKFLVLSGVTGGTALAAGATAVTWPQLLAAVRGEPLPGDARVLVLVTLYGGNDGLNTVIPAGDPAYRNARPGLAYGENEVLALEDGLGLNPAMKGFKALWDEGRLAIVRGVSYPNPDHSHFRSMAIWQTASPKSPVPTGWLGRWLDVTGADPLRAISLEPTLPPMLAGAKVAGAALRLGPGARRGGGQNGGQNGGQGDTPALGGPAPAALDLMARLGRPEPGEPVLQGRVATSLADLTRVTRTIETATRTARENAGDDEDEEEERTAPGASGGGQSRLAAQLRVVAQCIQARVPTRVYSVSLGGFDTHANEKATQSRLLGEVDGAISGFLRTVRRQPGGDKVVVAVYSEFGRRVRANASQGTDHGTSGPLFVSGDPVSGGFYGDQPSLTRLDDGDLHVTTDFRDVYATLLDKVLGADPAAIVGRGRTTMDFL